MDVQKFRASESRGYYYSRVSRKDKRTVRGSIVLLLLLVVAVVYSPCQGLIAFRDVLSVNAH